MALLLGACSAPQIAAGTADEAARSWREVCLRGPALLVAPLGEQAERLAGADIHQQLFVAREQASRIFGGASVGQNPEFTEAARGWLARWVYGEPPLLEFSHERWVLSTRLATQLLAQSAVDDDHTAAVRWANEAGGLYDVSGPLETCVAAVLRAEQQ
ncbi:MAG: hypothetical protein ACI81R_001311 [Bradymonadia bacterium]